MPPILHPDSLPIAACILISTLATGLHAGPETRIPTDAHALAAKEIEKPAITNGQIKVDGQTIPYRATAGKLALLHDDGTTRATIFHVSYERSDIPSNESRPVLFAFNGGPGSSSVWLHIGMLGPRIITLPDQGTSAPLPPVLVADNPHCLLDECDLVFVDPVSTGYSRVAKDGKASEFHGVEEDIQSVGDFIRRWITDHNRWSSPKFLLGESYGGVRVAGLSQHLQARYGMNLNGIILLSSLLDFSTLQESAGNDLPYLVYLPSYTTVAHHFGMIQGDRDELRKKACDFAFGPYASALLAGTNLTTEPRDEIARSLESLTGIPTDLWRRFNLRMGPLEFRAQLLRERELTLGRFDARVAWPSQDPTENSATYDPSYSLALGAFSSAMLDYLGRELDYKEEQPYEILTGKVSPWHWGSDNRILNTAPRIAHAMRDNPSLKVLIMAGHTDLATPPEGVLYSMRHLHGLPDGAKDRIETTFYDAGHMFYLNPKDLEKSRADLLRFMRSALP